MGIYFPNNLRVALHHNHKGGSLSFSLKKYMSINVAFKVGDIV
jgi:hypothetical protein